MCVRTSVQQMPEDRGPYEAQNFVGVDCSVILRDCSECFVVCHVRCACDDHTGCTGAPCCACAAPPSVLSRRSKELTKQQEQTVFRVQFEMITMSEPFLWRGRRA